MSEIRDWSLPCRACNVAASLRKINTWVLVAESSLGKRHHQNTPDVQTLWDYVEFEDKIIAFWADSWSHSTFHISHLFWSHKWQTIVEKTGRFWVKVIPQWLYMESQIEVCSISILNTHVMHNQKCSILADTFVF